MPCYAASLAGVGMLGSDGKLSLATATAASIDLVLAKKLAAGNAELAKDLFIMLINELPTTLQNINQAYAAGQLGKLRDHVHKLHGGCG